MSPSRTTCGTVAFALMTTIAAAQGPQPLGDDQSRWWSHTRSVAFIDARWTKERYQPADDLQQPIDRGEAMTFTRLVGTPATDVANLARAVAHTAPQAPGAHTAPQAPGAHTAPQAPVPGEPVEAAKNPVQQLTGKTLRVYDVPEANQGVAAGLAHFFAVDNSTLAKYEIGSGRLADRWVGARNGLIRHMNSCLVDQGRIRCANSNYPETPMGSSIEVFDPISLEHISSYSLGMRDEGSLTWFDRYRTGWIAGFSHYDRNGGVPFKDHSFSSVVTFDQHWRRTGGWLLPDSTLERMAPYASSGGAIGPDGWLYLLGHDRPELYVVGRPPMGPVLVHVATVAIESEGQAFSWAKNGQRVIYTIDRRQHLVRTIEVPTIVVKDPSARRFR